MGCNSSVQGSIQAAGAKGRRPTRWRLSRQRRNDYQTDPTISGDARPDCTAERPMSPVAAQCTITSTLLAVRPAAAAAAAGRSSRQMLVALYDFHSDTDTDLSFRKGDRLELLEEGQKVSSGCWWIARHADGREGYVPSNFVQNITTLETQEWYFGPLSRREAERALKSSRAAIGCFLVRASENTSNIHVLSVRGPTDSRTGEINIRHYKIETTSDGSFYIARHRLFSNYTDLIEHYKGEGLGLRLGAVCPRLTPPGEDSPWTRTDDKWEIDRRYLTFEKKLGAGQFGEVWRGTYKGNKAVAIKTLKPDSMSPDKFLEEAQMMKRCRHDRLVTLYAVCTRAQPFYIITELMAHGSLLEYLRNGPGQHVSLICLTDMAAQVASGMSYLERHQYIHRDLAARNVLVGESNVVKVADFGLARAIDDGEYNPRQGAKFPIKWTAPEAALFGKFSVKSDVWSFGVLLHEITTRGMTPYPGMNNREVLEQVDRGFRMPKSRLTPQPVYEKMLHCWSKDAALRPTFQVLCQFFEDYFLSTDDASGEDLRAGSGGALGNQSSSYMAL
ncbi:tyrosine-protein kinase Src-2-like isoform X2 [Babylonia areolata]|uniref:tyrosine-protein kinase Src-2-like isoform X2 n=1 Tax=Babylonia areolata TaxID=304850 RepID=UPI003FD53EB7